MNREQANEYIYKVAEFYYKFGNGVSEKEAFELARKFYFSEEDNSFTEKFYNFIESGRNIDRPLVLFLNILTFHQHIACPFALALAYARDVTYFRVHIKVLTSVLSRVFQIL